MPGKVRAHRCLVERGIAFRLDIGAKLLAEFLVRDAEHSAVAHTRQGQERGFDLGRIDVDAARNDHVALVDTEKEVTLPVEIPDIAERDAIVGPQLPAARAQGHTLYAPHEKGGSDTLQSAATALPRRSVAAGSRARRRARHKDHRNWASRDRSAR